MRLPSNWLFGALSVPPMLLLSVPLLYVPPVFGQTAAPAQGSQAIRPRTSRGFGPISCRSWRWNPWLIS